MKLKQDKLTAAQVAANLAVSVSTLTNWYKWYNDPKYVKPEGTPPLPEYEQTNSRAPRYWNPSDLPKLEVFKKWVPKGRGGIMGEFNYRYEYKGKGRSFEERVQEYAKRENLRLVSVDDSQQFIQFSKPLEEGHQLVVMSKEELHFEMRRLGIK